MANLISEVIGELSSPAAAANNSNPDVGNEPVIQDSQDDSVAYAHDSVVDTDEPSVSEEKVSSPQSDSSAGKAAAQANPKQGAAASQKPSGDKEVITVSDDKGKRKIEIDYTNRDSIKKAFEMSHGARKWQAERDQARTQMTELQKQYSEVRQTMDALEKAFQDNGELGVIDLIAGRQGASDEFLKRAIARANFLETAKPHEVEALQQKERLEKLERDLQRRELAEKQALEKASQEKEAAELSVLQGSANSVFEKYRFDGQLGDAADEQLFDEMLWNSTMNRLKPYEDQGVELSRELIDKEFRTVATQLRKRINVQAEKKAAAVVEQKKKEATESVQNSTMSAYKQGGAAKEASDLIGKGDFASLFRNWGKYRGAIK